MTDSKRYLVFVSSTFDDLKIARAKTFETIMSMDHFPAGMEIFPPADEEQWEFIRSIINGCDYYILIIGGRYGSTAPDGKSYTEKEFEFAVELGIPIIALLHENPEDLSEECRDTDEDIVQRLQEFREQVKQGRIVKLWSEQTEVGGPVATGLHRAFKMFPRIGWVRADRPADASALADLNRLHKENAELRQKVSEYSQVTEHIGDLAFGKDTFTVYGTWKERGYSSKRDWRTKVSWDFVWRLIGPKLYSGVSDRNVRYELKSGLFRASGAASPSAVDITLSDHSFEDIKLQLSALDLVTLYEANTVQGGVALFWKITQKGISYLYQIGLHRRKES